MRTILSLHRYFIRHQNHRNNSPPPQIIFNHNPQNKAFIEEYFYSHFSCLNALFDPFLPHSQAQCYPLIFPFFINLKPLLVNF